jgi:drug/metabolite transporter (DMT)-like permease
MAEQQEKTGRRFRITPREVAGAFLVILAVVFIAENGRRTKIRFVGPEVTSYLWLALLIAAALGFVAGMTVARSRAKK